MSDCTGVHFNSKFYTNKHVNGHIPHPVSSSCSSSSASFGTSRSRFYQQAPAAVLTRAVAVALARGGLTVTLTLSTLPASGVA